MTKKSKAKSAAPAAEENTAANVEQTTNTTAAAAPEPSTTTDAAPVDESSSSSSSSDSSSSDSPADATRATARRLQQSPTDAAAAAAASSESDVSSLPTVVYLSIEAPNGKSVKVETTPSDLVLDIRQFLLDCPETAEYTCYHLESPSFGPLNDYVELAEYPHLCLSGFNAAGQQHSFPVIKIVPELYDERASRLHVRRLRELLVKPPAHIQPAQIQTGYDNEENNGNNDKTVAVANKDKNKKKKGKKDKDDDIFKEFASTSAPSSSSSSSSSTATNNADKTTLSTFTDNFTLTNYHPSNRSRDSSSSCSLVDCVKHIGFSGWNPPPGNRRLQGDLLYLEFITVEGAHVHVTSNQEGYFVNQSTSTSFNPERADSHYKSLTLIELLKKLSPTFAQKYNKSCSRKITQHPFETMEMPAAAVKVQPWLGQAKAHTYDWNRSEDSLLNTYGMDNRGVQRDWNEEYQSCRELPKSSAPERVLRDRTMYRVYCDFVEAATKGAVAVVNGHIPPVNPMDAPKSFVFIYNNIFFSFAVDSKDLLDVAVDASGSGSGASDRVSYSMANHDLAGVRAYTTLDLDDLYTLSTVLVDYRGHRVIAQSIIPGIFHGDRASKHVYGSMNHGETIEANPAFHAIMLKAAEKLHLKPHSVVDAKGNAVELAACVESKGIIGSDGRNYILDLLRTFPRDANFLAPAKTEAAGDDAAAGTATGTKSLIHNSFLLRPELLNLYCHHKAFSQLFGNVAEQTERDNKRREALKQKIEEAEKEAQEKLGEDKQLDDTMKAQIRAEIEAKDTEEERNELDAKYNQLLQQFKFNPDSLTGVKLSDASDDAAADDNQLLDLAKYLKEDQLNKLIKLLRELDVSPVDTQHLTTILHQHGINIRYLSEIISLAQSAHLPHIETLCIQECIIRSAKHVFNGFLRNVTPDKSTSVLNNPKHINSIDNLYYGQLIAKFLNSLFGVNAMGHNMSEEQFKVADTVVKATKEEEEQLRKPVVDGDEKDKKKSECVRDMVIRLADGSRAPTDPLSPANLWQLIRHTVAEKFRFTLPTYLPMTARSKLCMLRSFCIKTGVQLVCKDFDLAPNSKNAVPFTVNDVLDMHPVVKAYLPRSNDAHDLYESGKAFLQAGNFGGAYQLLTESLNLHHQVYGPMHIDTAHVYSSLALVCFSVGELAQAIDFQQRAIIICERVIGTDSFETAHAHMNQALFLHNADAGHASTKHMNRALFLFELIAGPNHPDTAAAHINSALLSQESGRLLDALKHSESALERNQLALGPDHIQVAMSHHAVAVAHALLADFRSSVNHEKMAKQIYLNQLGPKSPVTVRTQLFLEHFTSLAVKFNKLSELTKLTKKSSAQQQATAQAAAAELNKLASPPFIMPPQLRNIMPSPLTWVSLNTPINRGRLNVNEILQMLEATSRSQPQTQTDDAATPATTTDTQQ